MGPPGSLDSNLHVNSANLPNLTGKLRLLRIVAAGSSGVVYRCLYGGTMEVAVKTVTFPPNSGPTEKEQFMRKVEQSLRLWRRLQHPNIAPFLGIAYDKDFGSDYPSMVLVWMKNGSLLEYVRQHGTKLSIVDRLRLIQGTVSGLAYLHSQGIIHGNFHPGNVLIDEEQNACLTDFGFGLSLFPMQDQLAYIWTDDIRPSGPIWVAPELLFPESYPNLKLEATFKSDVYSLGSIILCVLSGQQPWRSRGEAENEVKKFHNPPRPMWPVNMPDDVWDFIERCWSPRDPQSRPSVKEVLSFSTDKLEQLLQPNSASDINVVLFGALGSGKSSIINLFAEKEIAETSSSVSPCTKRPRWYRISMDGTKFRLWDTMGFFPAHEGSRTTHLLPYEHAHAVLRNLPDGVNLILLCVDKGIVTPSLRRLYWFINRFLFGGRAPIAFVVTHLDTPDKEWWKCNKGDIAGRTSIPIEAIPHVCVTAVQADHQSKHVLKELLQTYATTVAPIPLRPTDISSFSASDLATHCKLSNWDAAALVEKFTKPFRPFEVVFFRGSGMGTGTIIDLIAGYPVSETSPRSYKINTGLQQFRIWDVLDTHQDADTSDTHTEYLENARQLIRRLSGEGGIDLLVFCKRHGRLDSEELNRFKLFKGLLSQGQPPVAIIFTEVDTSDSVNWQKTNGDVFKSAGWDVIGHSCIPPLTNHDWDDAQLDRGLLKSRLSIETMLEDCVSSQSTWLSWVGAKAIAVKHVLWQNMSIKILMGRYGLFKEQAD